jgi:heme exporter protein B
MNHGTTPLNDGSPANNPTRPHDASPMAATPAMLTEPTGSEATLGVFAAFAWACRRDVRLAMRSKAELALILIFFLLVTSLFPLSVDPEPALLHAIGPGVAWVAALLALLLGLPHLFAADHADGTLEQIVLAPAPLAASIAGKVFAHWLVSSVPIIVLAPLIGLQFGLGADAIRWLVASLALGTPILCWLGAITAALTLGTRGGGALLALLVLPLAVPVLIFGAGAVQAAEAGLGGGAHLSLLGAGLIASCVLGPAATALAVRIAFE